MSDEPNETNVHDWKLYVSGYITTVEDECKRLISRHKEAMNEVDDLDIESMLIDIKDHLNLAIHLTHDIDYILSKEGYKNEK